jgi:hypothetical protein
MANLDRTADLLYLCFDFDAPEDDLSGMLPALAQGELDKADVVVKRRCERGGSVAFLA